MVDYYRLIRNAVAHPSKGSEDIAKKYFESNVEELLFIKRYYGMSGAPNSYDNIDFHDIKLFARTLLDMLKLLEYGLDPGDERLKSLVPFNRWSNQSETRSLNAAIGFLQSEYGVSSERAKKILVH